jgi:hypothetical protein
VRTIETIDRELALIATVRSGIRACGGRPSTAVVDQLLDERLESRTPAGP